MRYPPAWRLMSVTVRLSPSATSLVRSCRTEVRCEALRDRLAEWSQARVPLSAAAGTPEQGKSVLPYPTARNTTSELAQTTGNSSLSRPRTPPSGSARTHRGAWRTCLRCSRRSDRPGGRPGPACNAHRRRAGAVIPRATGAARARSPPKSLRMSARPLQNAANKKVDCRPKQGRRYRTLNEVT